MVGTKKTDAYLTPSRDLTASSTLILLRRPYVTRLTIPMGISHISGMAFGFACARYRFSPPAGGRCALESVALQFLLSQTQTESAGRTCYRTDIRERWRPRQRQSEVGEIRQED